VQAQGIFGAIHRARTALDAQIRLANRDGSFQAFKDGMRTDLDTHHAAVAS
jgi:hypothetical protein